MNYLFVAPRFASKVGAYYSFPIGLAYVCASLKRSGRKVYTLNLSHYEESQEELLFRYINDYNIDAVLTGGLSPHYRIIKQLLKDVRKAGDVITVVGGGLISSQPEVAMKGLGCDIGVVGEGEETIVEMAEALESGTSLKAVAGLAILQEKGVLVTKARSFISDLDSIAFPDLESFEMGRYIDMQRPNDFYYYYPFDHPREVPLISSRSCPFKCTFCYHPLGSKYRKRSIDSIFREVDHLVDLYRVNIVTFYDELFSASRSRMTEFCERIKPRNLKWQVQLRVDSVDRDILKMLKEAGCYYISYGIESASNRILQSMRKYTTREKIDSALSMSHDLGIGIQGNLIFGDPAETWETFQESMDWWMANRRYAINLSAVAAYPGSQIFKNAVEKKFIVDELDFLESGCPELNLTQMPEDQYREMHRIISQYCVEHFYWKGKLVGDIRFFHDQLKGMLFEFEAECPHCGSKSEYKNFSANCYYRMNYLQYTRIHCRHCNQRYDIPSLQKRMIGHIVKLYPNGKLSLWGAGKYAKDLMGNMPLNKTTVGRIFEDEPVENNRCLNGIPVLNPPRQLKNIKKNTDAILISSQRFEKKIYKKICSLEKEGVKIFRLYG